MDGRTTEQDGGQRDEGERARLHIVLSLIGSLGLLQRQASGDGPIAADASMTRQRIARMLRHSPRRIRLSSAHDRYSILVPHRSTAAAVPARAHFRHPPAGAAAPRTAPARPGATALPTSDRARAWRPGRCARAGGGRRRSSSICLTRLSVSAWAAAQQAARFSSRATPRWRWWRSPTPSRERQRRLVQVRAALPARSAG